MGKKEKTQYSAYNMKMSRLKEMRILYSMPLNIMKIFLNPLIVQAFIWTQAAGP